MGDPGQRVGRFGAGAGFALAAGVLGVQAISHAVFLHSLNRVGADFVNQIYAAGGDLLDGHATWLTRAVDASYTTAPYPPPAVFLLAPLAELPKDVAIGLWLALLAAAAVLTLPVLGIRDWRCHVLWLLSPPVVVGLYYGNITLLLVLALALMWRFRDRPGLCASFATAVAVVKLWPLVFALWMWLSARRRAAVLTLVAVPLLILCTWALLGFRGLTGYPSKLSGFSHRFARNGYSPVSVLTHWGVSVDVATVLALAAAVLLVAAARGRDEKTSLLLFVAAGLTASTIVWLHYLGFLVVPLAALSPRLGALWLYFPSLWISADLFAAYRQPAGALAAVLLTAVFVALVAARARSARLPATGRERVRPSDRDPPPWPSG